MRSMRRRVARSLLVTAATAILAMTGVLCAAQSASATTAPGVNATPQNEGGEWWSTDGCSHVPDTGNHTTMTYVSTWTGGLFVPVSGPFDFHHACVHHDGCYREHWADRETCDSWFRNDMYASCEAIGSNAACYARADLYYYGVRILGSDAWSNFRIVADMSYYV